MIEEILVFPQSQLPCFLFPLRFGTADQNKSVSLFPVLRRIDEPGDLPLALLAEGAESESCGNLLDWLRHLGNDDITHTLAVEKMNDAPSVETSVDPKPNRYPFAMDILRELGLADSEHSFGSRDRMGIPRT